MKLSERGRGRIVRLVVVLFPILLNSAQLFGVLKSDAPLSFSALATNVVPGPLPIHPNFDGSIGWVFQPLGYRSAEELVHGHLPWWNSYQGIGAPLAGEMTPGSFFPLIFLELLPNGQTILDVAVEIAAGIFMFLLARRLGLGLLASSVAALLFETNGTFAWLRSGWCYPLPALPLLIYGVELTLGSTLRDRAAGTVVVGVAICVSITGAMIEVAYLDSLLAIAWALLRLVQTQRSERVDRFVRLVLGAAAGLLLAAPLLIAFIDYLSISYVGSHTGELGSPALDARQLPQMIVPYLLGPTAFYHDGGYGGFAVTLVALCGLFGRFRRGIRILLGGWIFVAFAVTIQLPIVFSLFAAIPGVKYIAFGRYLDGSWEFALALLAALLIHDAAKDVRRMWLRCAFATLAIALTLAAGISSETGVVHDAFATADSAVWCWASVVWMFIATELFWSLNFRTTATWARAVVVGVVLVLEASFNYAIPTLGYPVAGTLVEGSVDFLRAHDGLQRFFTFGPINPNDGSYFDVASLDDAELPVAKNWADYMTHDIDPHSGFGMLGGANPDELAKRALTLEDDAVRYVVTNAGYRASWNVDEPVDSTVAADSVPILAKVPRVTIRLGSLPRGTLASIGLMQNNGAGAADGRLDVRVCSGGRCVAGRRPFSESANNVPFWVDLDRPVDVLDGSVSIAIGQSGATVSDALWLYGPGPGADETVDVDGKRVDNRAAQVLLDYGASDTDRSQPTALNATGGRVRATVNVPADAGRDLAGFTIDGTVVDRSKGARACALGRCEPATVSRTEGDATRFALRHPLPVAESYDVTLDGARPRGRAIAFGSVVARDRPKLVYSDALADVFELPHPSPYFSAAGCSAVPRDREHLAVRCDAPSRLTRRELYVPGWSATVNGAAADVSPIGRVFQSIALPAGASSVAFAFEPPNVKYGYAAFALGLLILWYSATRYGRRRTTG